MTISRGMTCRKCKQSKSPKDFPEGHLLSSHIMVCSACRGLGSGNKQSKVISQEHIRRAKSKWEQMIEYRAKNKNRKLQDDLWQKLCDIDIEADAESFSNSEELDNMMERYEHALMLYISGLEDMPEWMNPEEENGTTD